MAKRPGFVISWLRNALAGRNIEQTAWLRSPNSLSPRTQPPPNLPGGVAHKLNSNYYYTRDLRRAVPRPTVITTHKALLPNKDVVSSDEVAFPQMDTPPIPGKGHTWTPLQHN